MKNNVRLPLVGLGMLGMALGLPGLASGQGSGTTTLQANLQPVPTNMVAASGTAAVALTGDTLSVTIHATGLDPTMASGLPAHAQHIHIGGTHTCPTASTATMHNGHLAVSAKDGLPAYGPIQVSLTTGGDTSPASGFALKRFPQTPSGTEDYSRTITVSPTVAQEIRNNQGVVVIHGIDYLHNGSYKDLGPSQLMPSLPLEGTAPALCGQLVSTQIAAVPTGAPQTGGGSTAGLQDAWMLGLGAALLAGGAGALAYRRRVA